MKKLILSLLVVSFSFRCTVVAQTREKEIRQLIAAAPVVAAAKEAEGEDALIIWHWLMALAYSGHTSDAFLAAQKLNKIMGRENTLSAIAIGLAINQKPDEALALLRQIKHSESQAIAIEVLCYAARFSDALLEIKKIQDRQTRDNALKGIVKRLCSLREIAQALTVTEQIKDAMTLRESLKLIAAAYLKTGKITEALAISTRIKPVSYDKTPFFQVVTDAANEFSDEGFPDKALLLIDLIEDEKARAWPLSNAAEALAEEGRLMESTKIAHMIKDSELSAKTLMTCAIECRKRGLIDDAKKLLKESFTLAEKSQNTEQQEKIFFLLIASYAEAGFTTEALDLTAKMEASIRAKRGFEKTSVVDEVGKALIEAGNIQQAIELLQSYREVILFPRSSIIALVKQLAKADNASIISKVRNSFAQWHSVDREIVEGLIESDKLDEATAFAQTIQDLSDRSESFTSIAVARLKAGQYEKARIAADSCPSLVLRMNAYLEIFDELISQRNQRLRTEKQNFFAPNN